MLHLSFMQQFTKKADYKKQGRKLLFFPRTKGEEEKGEEKEEPPQADVDKPTRSQMKLFFLYKAKLKLQWTKPRPKAGENRFQSLRSLFNGTQYTNTEKRIMKTKS